MYFDAIDLKQLLIAVGFGIAAGVTVYFTGNAVLNKYNATLPDPICKRAQIVATYAEVIPHRNSTEDNKYIIIDDIIGDEIPPKALKIVGKSDYKGTNVGFSDSNITALLVTAENNKGQIGTFCSLGDTLYAADIDKQKFDGYPTIKLLK
jgi:hypothetical protein